MRLIIICLAAVMALTGCQQRKNVGEDDGPAVVVVTDKETGCQYLKLATNNNTLTPRLDDQGRPMCPGVLP